MRSFFASGSEAERSDPAVLNETCFRPAGDRARRRDATPEVRGGGEEADSSQAQNDGSATSGHCDGQLLHIDGGAKKSGFFAQNDKKGAAQIKTPPPQDRNEII